MNKSQFIFEMNEKLQSIPVGEREELIEDYESHFVFGLQQGKTEEEISAELGNPSELANEILEQYKKNVYDNEGAQLRTDAPAIKYTAHKSRTVFSIIGLFLLNFVCAVMPVFLVFWSVWVSLILAFAIAGLSPLVAAVDFIVNDYISLTTLFFSIAVTGLSIFMLGGLWYVGQKLYLVTKLYINWNIKVWKGVE